MDLPTMAEMRKMWRLLNAKPDRTELPKQVNIEERKRKNRARANNTRRVVKWQRIHREAYNAKMRAYRQRRKLEENPANADKYSVPSSIH